MLLSSILSKIEQWQVAILTWVEEDDGSQAAELCLIHVHIFHFGYQLCQDSAGDQIKSNETLKDNEPKTQNIYFDPIAH